MEMITNLSARVDDQVNVLEKSQRDAELRIKKIEGKIITMEKRQAVQIDQGEVKAAAQGLAAGGSGGNAGGGGMSKQQIAINNRVQEQLEDLDQEVNRLQRIDIRLNKELVEKPYLYIDKIKKELIKEQNEIVKLVKGNNKLFTTKISQVE